MNTEPTITQPVSASVQNGTRKTEHSVDSYVERFEGHRRRGAKAIIELCEVLVEAEFKLPKTNFKAFCERVDIEHGKSEHKKLRTIGKSAERLREYMDQLPMNWTTIYKLAQMDEGKFNELVEDGRLSPNLTGREIDEFLQKPPKKKKQKEVYVSFKTPDPDTRRKIIAALRECVAEFEGKALIVETDPASPVTAGDEQLTNS